MPKGFTSKVREEFIQTVSFSLSGSWKLPDFYETAHSDDIQTSLELGVKSFQAVREFQEEHAGATNEQLVQEKAAKKIADTERRLALELDVLRKERTGLLGELEELRGKIGGMAAVADERAAAIRTTAAAEAERSVCELLATVDALRSVIASEDSRRNSDIKRVIEACNKERERAIADKESMIEYLKGEKQQRDLTVKELQEQLLARGKVKANAALRGKEGEEEFAELADGMGWHLERTAGESHQCDYKGDVRGMGVYFEIKAHADTVPSKELVKFHRDMKEHPEIGAGVFIAMTAPLRSNGKSGFWTEWTEDGRILVFVGEFLTSGIPVSYTLGVISQLLGVAGRIWEARMAGEQGVAAGLEGRLRQGTGYLEGAAGRLRLLYNKLVIDRKAALDAYDGTLGMVKLLKDEVAMTLGVLLGTYKFDIDEGTGDAIETITAVSEKPVAKSSGASKKKKSSAANS
jgi:hypothetical protein